MEIGRTEELKRILREKKQEIAKGSLREMKKFISGENREAQGAGMEEGDCSFVMQAEELSMRHLSSQKHLLRQLDLALDRLNHGSYGTCAGCMEEISPERLRVVPFALYCKDCQETFERRRRPRN
ncbi:MAG: TraR/DksA family transcriptional regulator [Nitrospirales bacterium]|nr:TraR/DksA family transcriptional regulator [Nitrospirales bacterium]